MIHQVIFFTPRFLQILDIQPHFLLCACLRLHWEQGQGRLPALSVCFCGQFQTPESCVYPVPSKTQEPSWHECRCHADRNSVPVPSGTNDCRYFLPCGRVPRCFLTRADTVFQIFQTETSLIRIDYHKLITCLELQPSTQKLLNVELISLIKV